MKKTTALTSALAVLALAAGAGALSVLPAAGTEGGPAGGAPGTGAGGEAVETLTMPAPPTVLVCPDIMRVLVAPGEGDPEFSATPEEVISQVSAAVVGSSGSFTLDDFGAATSVQSADDEVVTGVLGPVVTAAGSGGVPLAAVTATSTGAGDLRGLAAIACQPTGSDFWLLGGSTERGSSTRLLLTNPAATVAEVSYLGYGAGGPVWDEPRTVALGPGETRSVLVEGFAPDSPVVAVHVTATGATISAALATTRLDGLIPIGVSYVAPAGPAAVSQLVGPVVIDDAGGEGGAASDGATVRLLAETDAEVTISVVGPNGTRPLSGLDTITIYAGQPFDVPLGSLAAGIWYLQIDSTQPVLSAVRSTRPGPDGTMDLAWAAGGPLPGEAIAALPAGTHAELVLASSDGVDGGANSDGTSTDGTTSGAAFTATVTTYTDGEATSSDVEIAPGSSVVVPLTGADAVAVTSAAASGGATLWGGIVLTSATDATFIEMLEFTSVAPADVTVAVTVK